MTLTEAGEEQARSGSPTAPPDVLPEMQVSQMELSAGRETYESGDMMQTQKVIFIVLIQSGNANHTE